MRFPSLLAALILFLLSVISAQAEATGPVKFRTIILGEHKLRIPADYVVMAKDDIWLNNIPGLDTAGDEALLMIPASYFKRKLAGYIDRQDDDINDVSIRLVAVTEQGAKAYRRGGNLVHIFLDAGRTYRIVHDPSRKTYQVYRRGVDAIWDVLLIDPKTTQTMPADVFSYWIAGCIRYAGREDRPGRFERCSSYTLVGNMVVHFSFNAQNLQSVPALRDTLGHLIEEWKVD